MADKNDKNTLNSKKNKPLTREKSIFANLKPVESSNPFPSASPSMSSPLSGSLPSSSDVNVLNQKLENMEKNILKRVESKIAEQFKQNIATKQPEDIAVKLEGLLKKVEQMDCGLKDIRKKNEPAPSQAKDMESFKANFTKEIMGFLQSIKEQKKNEPAPLQAKDMESFKANLTKEMMGFLQSIKEQKKNEPAPLQAKDMESFKANLTKEMMGFLQSVKEQDKSSEFNRQTREQIEKSSLKTDELQKKFDNFLKLFLKQLEAQKKSITIEDISQKTDQIINEKLKAFLGPLNDDLDALSGKVEGVKSVELELEEKLSGIGDILENRMMFLETTVKESSKKYSLTLDDMAQKTGQTINEKLKTFFGFLNERLNALSGKVEEFQLENSDNKNELKKLNEMMENESVLLESRLGELADKMEETRSEEIETRNDLRKVNGVIKSNMTLFESGFEKLKANVNKMTEGFEDFSLGIKKKVEDDCIKVAKDLGNKFSGIMVGVRESCLSEQHEELDGFFNELKTDLHSEVKACFKWERNFLKDDIGGLSNNIHQECKELNEIQKAVVDNASESKSELKTVINDYFSGERELFRKDMADIALKFDGEHKKLGEIQNAIINGVTETQSDLRNMIKKYFFGENELIKRELSDVSRKFGDEYERLGESQGLISGNISEMDAKAKELLQKMRNAFIEGENSFMDKAEVHSNHHIVKIKEFCEKTSNDLFSAEAVSYHLDELRSKLFNIGRNLSQFIKEVDGMGLEPVLGAAGIKMKRELESLRHNLVQLQSETESFDKLEYRIERALENTPETKD